MTSQTHTDFQRMVSAPGLMIAMGNVFGYIDNSPPYTNTTFFHEGEIINAAKAPRVLSAVFWNSAFITPVKYISIVLRPDSNGEGGILYLFALVRRYFSKWLILPAIIGAAFIIAYVIITTVRIRSGQYTFKKTI